MTPPTPDPAFRWTTETWGLALRCAPLGAIAQHLFTSAQLKLRSRAPLDAARWTSALSSLGAGPDRLTRVTQVHGRAIRVVRRGEATASARRETPEGDAIISNADDVVLAVVVADCVPILLADRRNGAAAAIHAGWRGTCAGIVRETVAAMVREFGTRAQDLTAAIGPSIGPGDYEVGEELVDTFREAGHERAHVERWFVREADAPLRLDLWRATGDQLLQAGLRPECIASSGLSTFRHPGLLESYRRDGTRAGRMAAVIRVPAFAR